MAPPAARANATADAMDLDTTKNANANANADSKFPLLANANIDAINTALQFTLNNRKN